MGEFFTFLFLMWILGTIIEIFEKHKKQLEEKEDHPSFSFEAVFDEMPTKEAHTRKKEWFEEYIEEKFDALIALMTVVAYEEGGLSSIKARFIDENVDSLIKEAQRQGADETDIFLLKMKPHLIVKRIDEAFRDSMSKCICFHRCVEKVVQRCTSILADQGTVMHWETILFLINFSYADGMMNECQKSFLRSLGLSFGIETTRIDTIFKEFENEFNTVSNNDIEWAYEILGVTKGETLEEVKKRYRNLAEMYHPDVVAANGGSEEEIADAKKRMSQINEAYETIKRSLDA